MNYLLDVNILVAWGWSDHTDHDRVVTWISRMKLEKNARLLTSPIPQIGFVRVSVQRAGGLLTVDEASETLIGMLASLGKSHAFLPDDQPVEPWPAWCKSAGHTTDAHLQTLAERHRARLATLDSGIPRAYLLPI